MRKKYRESDQQEMIPNQADSNKNISLINPVGKKKTSKETKSINEDFP